MERENPNKTIPAANPENRWVLDYLKVVENSGLSPNFFMSEEYLEAKGLEWIEERGLWGCRESGEPGWYLPPVRVDGGLGLHAVVWAGLPGVEGPEFLDYEFIYDPQRFLSLGGHHWSVFRKNVRKWPMRMASNGSEYRRLAEDECMEEGANLFASWAGGGEVFDPETMLRMVVGGRNRAGLFRGGVLVGMNVWDWNWMYVNFRLCLDNGEPFLQEYLRWLFYTSPVILDSGKLVNDGGCLGSGGLFNFKMKLHPVEVRKIYSQGGVHAGFDP